jgi:hypothetical protein
MSKKYYYTDAIVALYMMKEFGVGIYKENQDVSNWNLADLLCIDFGRIYVTPESEHIFEPKKGDLAHYDLNGGSGVYQFTNKPIRWAEGVTNIQIIRRDNKQFFYPEVVND